MYTILVGRPGIGKGEALRSAITLLRESKQTKILSDRLTIEYIIERMAKGFPVQVATTAGGVAFGQDSSAILFAPELSVFATAPQHTLPILAELWENKDEFQYGTKNKGDYVIKNPCFNILSGSTQEWLMHSIPSSSVGGGFTRRVNFVYAKDRSQALPWPASNSNSRRVELVHDLQHISNLKGEVKFHANARPVFEKYHADSVAGEFDDEATAAYKTSKWVHALKLATVLSTSRNDTLEISKQDLEEAIAWVEKVVATVAHVFRGVGDSDLVASADKILKYLEIKGYASRQEILRALWRHVTALELDVILQTLMQAGMVKEDSTAGKVLYRIVPVIKTKTKGTP